MSHVTDSPINRHFEPISGRFTPIRPTNQRQERKGPATFRRPGSVVGPQRPPGHCSAAPRYTPPPHPTSGIRSCADPPSLATCLTPTTDLSKTERDPIATSGPTISVWHQTGRSLRKKQSVCPGSPPLDRSLTAGGAQRQSLQACLPMAISRNSCSLLDFPEFAQAVSYGVPGTHVILREDGPEWARFSRPRRRSNLMSTDGEP